MPSFVRLAAMVVAALLFGIAPMRIQAAVCNCASSDFDRDGDVDQSDFGHLQKCFTGDGSWIVPGCEDTDLDGNGVINLDDYEAFFACMTGPNIPAPASANDGILITEFMASNGNGLTDEDGDHPDWIELYNSCRPAMNLEGWYLTDDPAELTKWQFPSVTIGKGKFLMVYASGKDRAESGHPLHTSFKLSADGDFLALVAPDGQTIVHAYTPQYPEQLGDLSFGLTQSATQIVAPRTAARYHVPLITDAAIGTAWTNLSYNDATWSSGNTGLGFSSIPPYFTVTVYKGNGSVCSLDAAESLIINPSSQAWTASEFATVVNYLNTVDPAHFDNDATFPGMQIGNDINDFAVLVTGTIVIPAAGEWTFGVSSDDGFGLRLSRGTTVLESSYPPPRGPSDTLAVFNIPEAGAYDVRLVYYECGGGAELEFFAAPGYYEQFDANAFRLVGDSANGGLAIGVLGGTIETDLGPAMLNRNASVWARLPFQLADPAAFNFMALRMKYEDGFVAWLNGHEVARRNAPATVTWNSAAYTDREVTDAADYEEIELSGFLSYLRAGANVLAIQGLNDAATNPDFLVLPELVVGQTVMQNQYFAAPTPGTYNTAGDFDFVRALSFSVEHGFFSNPFQVAITSPTPDIEIRYTLDGSTPTPTNGAIYAGPLTVSETSVVRAAGFRENFLPSRVATQTYLFVNDVLAQSPDGELPGPGWPADGAVNGHTFNYGMDPNILNDSRYSGQVDDALLAIPSVSLVTDLPNLFDPSIGIYVNPGGDGRAWERPASVELINPDGSPGFQINAGLRIRGGYSRSNTNPKHAFRLFFRSDYGDGKLNFPLFGSEGANEFSKVDLATAQNYSWSFEYGDRSTFLRDVFSRDSQRDLGEPYARTRYYHLYINGVYWGLFYTDERTEADYAATYFGGSDDDYDVIKVDPGAGYYIYATNGNMDAWYRLWQLCGEDGTTQYGSVTNDVYQQLRGCNPDGSRNTAYEVLVDADNLIDYMLCTIFTGDPDGPVAWGGDFPNNFYAVHDRNGLSGFRFFRHDAEHSMGCATGDPNENRTGPYDAGRTFDRFNPFRLHQDLITCTDYRTRFADRVYQAMFNGGAFTPEATTARVAARRDEIDLAIIAESARWGDSKGEPPRNKLDHWLPSVNWLLDTYLPNRTNVVTQQLRDKGWFKDPPILNRPGGNVAVGTEISLAFPAGGSGTIYYTLDGSDPRLPGGAVSPQAHIYEASATTITLLPRQSTWRYLDNGSNLTASWRALAFDDSAWKGPQAARLGYGGDGETQPALSYGPNSNQKYITYYFRRILSVGDTSNYTGLTLRLQRDDGAVVYINGTKVDLPPSVSNMPDAFDYLTTASTTVGGGDEQTFFEANISPSLLIPNADNIIAVEVHQRSADSSDLGFDLELVATEVVSSDPIIIAQNTRLKARILDGGEWTALNAADYLVGPVPLYINELMAANKTTLEDPEEPGEHPDWFELYNPNAFEVDLGGMYVTDNLANPTQWRLPDGLSIGAGKFLLFYADSDPTQGPRHVNFKLSNDGEAIGLFARDGVTAVDTITFDAQADDVAYGRYPDGTGSWGVSSTPTPGDANAPHQ